MRDMRSHFLVLSLGLLAGCGDDATKSDGGADLAMSVSADMTAGADLSVRTPNGVSCGDTSCSVGQSCCVQTSNGQVTGAACIAAAGSCSGSTLACDGPEDCSSAKSYCCATLTLNPGDPDGGAPSLESGSSSCVADCQFSFDQASSTVSSRLCQVADDCVGLSVLGIAKADKCCSSPMAPNLHFCFVGAFAAQVGLTCK
jgi:hypothetical protein